MNDVVTSVRPCFGIEITRQCNLRCPHCFTASGGAAHPGPSTEAICRLLSELAQSGIKSVAFSGGEPLLRKDLPTVISFGKSCGISDVGLVTNGYLATPFLVKDLADAGLLTVQVSIDGVDAQDHARVRNCGPADYYRALRAIRLFKECGIATYVATIISSRNVARVAEMALFCEALGVAGLRYCTFVPKGRATNAEQIDAYRVPPKLLDDFIEFIQSLNAASSVSLPITIDHAIGPWSSSGTFCCESGKRVAYVSAEGDLYPCPSLISEPFRVGNVFDTPIRKLLEHPAMSRVRQISRHQLRGPCATCSNQGCRGGCRGAAFAFTGDVHGANPYCYFRSTHENSD
jgi:radical SAM protein with 4Fe4S-binding SPASM domain